MEAVLALIDECVHTPFVVRNVCVCTCLGLSLLPSARLLHMHSFFTSVSMKEVYVCKQEERR